MHEIPYAVAIHVQEDFEIVALRFDPDQKLSYVKRKLHNIVIHNMLIL